MASKTEESASVEKENNSTEEKPLGVKFTYGIPGREVQNKNRVDLPPRPTNAPKGPQQQRGGGVAGRGFGRGRGQNHGHQQSQGGRYQGHGHPKPRNRPPSPKTGKTGEKEKPESSSSTSTCDFCDRPCTEVVCRACGYVGANLRVKKECSKHPRIIRVLDLEVCPQCKTANIEESEEKEEKK